MTPIACANALAKFLEEAFKKSDYAPTDEKISFNKITIRDGFLPKRTSAKDKQEQNPCIVIRPVKITDTEKISTIELQLLALTYNSDPEKGHLEIYHILEFVRQQIEINPKIANRFRLSLPLTIVIPEEQPFPEWWAYMQIVYTIPHLNPQYTY